MSSLTIPQQTALAIVPKVSGSIAFLCSILIVYSISRSFKKRSRLYHRLLWIISIVDAITSFWAGILSTWPMPSSSTSSSSSSNSATTTTTTTIDVRYAVGNEATCTMQGFFLFLSVISPMLHVGLAMYYMLILKYKWDMDRITSYEKFMYAVPLMWTIGSAIVGLSLQVYNPTNLWCSATSYPLDCNDGTSSTTTNANDCIRGVHAQRFQMIFFFGPLWISIILITFCQLVVSWDVILININSLKEVTIQTTTGNSRKRNEEDEEVQQQEEHQKQPDSSKEEETNIVEASYRNNNMNDTTDNENENNAIDDKAKAQDQDQELELEQEQEQEIEDDEENEQMRKLRQKRREERAAMRRRHSREILTQCTLYTITFYLNWFPVTTIGIQQLIGIEQGYPILLMAAALTPAFGIFNIAIYIYPSFLYQKREHPDGTILLWLQHSLY